MHRWMGEVFYRHVDPSRMGYAELQYFSNWHRIIKKEEATREK